MRYAFIILSLSLVACNDVMQSDKEADIAYDAFLNVCLPIMRKVSEIEDVMKLDAFEFSSELDETISRSYPRNSKDYSKSLQRTYDYWRYEIYPAWFGNGFIVSDYAFYKPTPELPSALKFMTGPYSVTYQEKPVHDESYHGYGCSMLGIFTNADSVHTFKKRLVKFRKNLTLINQETWHLRKIYIKGKVRDYKFCSKIDEIDSNLSVRFSHYLIAEENRHGPHRFKVGLSNEPCDTSSE